MEATRFAAPAFEADDGAKPDAALLAACAEGDNDALGELFDRHHQAVYRFVGRLSRGSVRDADDLVQATFLEVHRAAKRFRGGSAVKTWIFGIAANVTRHHRRSEMRRRGLIEEASEVASLQPARPARPDESAEHRETIDRLAEALAALPHDLRVVFVACEIEDLPGVDVARSLGIREGTLWRRLHDARKALVSALDRRSEA